MYFYMRVCFHVYACIVVRLVENILMVVISTQMMVGAFATKGGRGGGGGHSFKPHKSNFLR